MHDPRQITLVAFLASSTAVVIACVVLATLRARSVNSVARGLLLSAALVALVLAPALYDQLILRLNATTGLQRVYINPSPASFLAPSVVGLLAFVAATMKRPNRLGG